MYNEFHKISDPLNFAFPKSYVDFAGSGDKDGSSMYGRTTLDVTSGSQLIKGKKQRSRTGSQFSLLIFESVFREGIVKVSDVEMWIDVL